MLTNQQRITLIKEKLEQALQPELLEVIDESHQHIGHAGAQSGAGHFAVKIKADTLTDKSRIAAHRMIYAALDNMIPTEIHALRIIIAN